MSSYAKLMDSRIHSSGPCLTNATYTSVSADETISSKVQVSGGRTDDWVRVFFHVRYDVLKSAPFSRIAFYQHGADNYAYHNKWTTMEVGTNH